MFKSSLFLILVILPIALQSDRLARLEMTDAGKTVLNTIMIQTKLNGVNSQSIKNVLEASQVQNQSGLDKYEEQAKVENASCEADRKSLTAALHEAVGKRYTLEKTNESTKLLKDRKVEYSKLLQVELDGYNAFVADINKVQESWTAFYNSMLGSIKTAQENLGKIRAIVNKANPHNAPSFAEVESKESMISEIKSNLEYRFYDTIGMKPILTGLLQVVSKGIDTNQFYKISHTMDLIDNFLANRRNNLIEDNEYSTTLSSSLSNSLQNSVTSTQSEKDIVDGLVSSLDTRVGLLATAVTNAVQLTEYARNVFNARRAICEDFQKTYLTHVRRYNNVRLAIAELSNTFDDEYKDFVSFIERKMQQ